MDGGRAERLMHGDGADPVIRRAAAAFRQPLILMQQAGRGSAVFLGEGEAEALGLRRKVLAAVCDGEGDIIQCKRIGATDGRQNGVGTMVSVLPSPFSVTGL